MINAKEVADLANKVCDKLGIKEPHYKFEVFDTLLSLEFEQAKDNKDRQERKEKI